MRRALAIGVKIALGTDAAVYPHGNNALGIRSHDRRRHAQRRKHYAQAPPSLPISSASPIKLALSKLANLPTSSPSLAIRSKTLRSPKASSSS